MNIRFNTVLAFLFLTLSAPLLARPLDATGKCPLGASLRLADGAFKGDAQVMWSATDFSRRHAIATQGEEPWIHLLTGRSGLNRVYQTGTQQVIVTTICNPADCERNRAYIAFERATGVYGGSVYEGKHVREFGATPEDRWYAEQIGAALICAQNLDWGRK